MKYKFSFFLFSLLPLRWNSRTFSITTNFFQCFELEEKISFSNKKKKKKVEKKTQSFNVIPSSYRRNFPLWIRRHNGGKIYSSFFNLTLEMRSEASEEKWKKSNKHIMACLVLSLSFAMYTYTWKVFVCFHPDKRFIFPFSRQHIFASPLQFHNRCYCRSAMPCLLMMFRASLSK